MHRSTIFEESTGIVSTLWVMDDLKVANDASMVGNLSVRGETRVLSKVELPASVSVPSIEVETGAILGGSVAIAENFAVSGVVALTSLTLTGTSLVGQ